MNHITALKKDIEKRIDTTEKQIEFIKADYPRKDGRFKTQKAKDIELIRQDEFLYTLQLVLADMEYYKNTKNRKNAGKY